MIVDVLKKKKNSKCVVFFAHVFFVCQKIEFCVRVFVFERVA